MKCFLKIVLMFIATLALFKAIQVGIDFLYQSYGKRYICTDDIT